MSLNLRLTRLEEVKKKKKKKIIFSLSELEKQVLKWQNLGSSRGMNEFSIGLRPKNGNKKHKDLCGTDHPVHA